MLNNNVFELNSIKSTESFYGRASMSLESWGVSAACEGGEDSYIVGYRLPEAVLANGVMFEARLRDWKHIKYAAVGYMHEGSYCHVKSLNIRKDGWVTFGFTHDDIIWTLQGGDRNKAAVSIDDVRIFVKGQPKSHGAYIDIGAIALQLSQNMEFSPERRLENSSNQSVVDAIYEHLKRGFREYTQSAEEYMGTGQCPMPGKQFLQWRYDEPKPEGLGDVNTFDYAWNAQHPAINLLIYARENNQTGALIAARSLVESWLDNSFYSQPDNFKYVWYDHGTAERLLAFLLLWDQGIKNGFDFRFMGRLNEAIHRHADLLSSEAFYAFNQRFRYHNHAWFQDAGLLAAALVMPQATNASFWRETAVSRFNDQLDNLIVRDGGYAIFVENSIGYHHGVQNLAKFVGELVELSGEESEIPRIAEELVAWSDFLRYPDGRVPAQGDTFRLPPRTGEEVRRGKPWENPGCTVLPKAGYAVIKGNHEGKPWMLVLFNTCLSETHKHEDNLSITLWFDGVEWLIDPSFYSHEYSDEVPSKLRACGAHNTFYPDRKYSTTVLKSSVLSSYASGDDQVVKAEYHPEGNIRLIRTLSFDGAFFPISFWDEIESDDEGSTRGVSSWHAGENVSIKTGDKKILLNSADSEWVLTINFNPRPVTDLNIHVNSMLSGQGFLETGSTQIARVSFEAKLCCTINFERRGLKSIED